MASIPISYKLVEVYWKIRFYPHIAATMVEKMFAFKFQLFNIQTRVHFFFIPANNSISITLEHSLVSHRELNYYIQSKSVRYHVKCILLLTLK